MRRFYLKQLNIVLKAAESGADWRMQAEVLTQKLEGELRVVISNKQEADAGILWLTDCPHTAGMLMHMHLPVVIWLHEGNRQCSFPDVPYAVEKPFELDADFFDKIYRRYAGIPWEIAETERCIIRETTVEDVDSFARIYREPGITKYTDAFCIEPRSEREYVKEYVKKVYDFFGYGVWTVLWKETGEVIGRVGFEQPVAGEKHDDSLREEGVEDMLTLGYMIAAPWQGKGIAQEVCRAALAFAREELQVTGVQVWIDAENLASLRVAEKLGFQGKFVDLAGKRYFKGSCLRAPEA